MPRSQATANWCLICPTERQALKDSLVKLSKDPRFVVRSHDSAVS
jgi:hypothetical protein